MIYGLIALAIIMGFGLFIDAFEDVNHKALKPSHKLNHDTINAIFLAFESIESSRKSDVEWLLKTKTISKHQVIALADNTMSKMLSFSISKLEVSDSDFDLLLHMWRVHVRDLKDDHGAVREYITRITQKTGEVK